MPSLDVATVDCSKPLVWMTGRDRLPTGGRYLHLLCHALKVPGAAKVCTPLLRRALNMPKSSGFMSGFYSMCGRLHCGENAWLGGAFFLDYAPVYIDDYAALGYFVVVVTHGHDVTDYRRIIAKPVVIERNVWVASNVTILGGVRIGQNSIIGAGSVVVKDIPSNVFACGNPCRPVKVIVRDAERWRDEAASKAIVPMIGQA